MTVHEFYTWSNSPRAKQANATAVMYGKSAKGLKFTVAIGEWGVRTFLVLGATSKDEAKKATLDYFSTTPGYEVWNMAIKVRDVTKCKKYN